MNKQSSARNGSGKSGGDLSLDLGIRQSSAWLLLHKIRESWRIISGRDLVYGTVEVD